MKKYFFVGVCGFLAAVLVLGGCSGKRKGLVVGVSKIVSHPALDAVERGLADELEAAGLNATFDWQNANGDVNTAAQIASRFKDEGVALAVGVGTPVAVALATVIADAPVVFTAVTDPVAAGLVDKLEGGKGNVTGMSDAIPVASQIKLFKDVAALKTLGYVYTSNEANSISALADVRSACEALGIELVAQSISSSSEVRQAAEAIAGRVDGVYVTTDNTVYSALPSLIEVCRRLKTPFFSADVTSCMDGGAMIAQGFSYYKAGRATGAMVVEILGGKRPEDIPVRFLTEPNEFDLLFDLDEAANCGIAIPPDILRQANYIFQNGALAER
ncbi:MAG: ABC transporter substrate-binding protein [Spirochaetaceae bacterium]|nr:ABC transporter substrate-binding protein [Spirochaetaceae bacterium]